MEKWFKTAIEKNRTPAHTYLAVGIYTHDEKQQNRTDLEHLKAWRTKNYLVEELPGAAALYKGRAVRLDHAAPGVNTRQVGKMIETRAIPSRKEIYAVFAIDTRKHVDIINALRTGDIVGVSSRELASKTTIILEDGRKLLVKTPIDVSFVLKNDPPNRPGCDIFLCAQTNEAGDITMHDDISQIAIPDQPFDMSTTNESTETPKQEEEEVKQDGAAMFNMMRAKIEEQDSEIKKQKTIIGARESQDKERFDISNKQLEEYLKDLFASQPDAQKSATDLMKARDSMQNDSEWLSKANFNDSLLTVMHSAGGGRKRLHSEISATDATTTHNDSSLNQQLQPKAARTSNMTPDDYSGFNKASAGAGKFMDQFFQRPS